MDDTSNSTPPLSRVHSPLQICHLPPSSRQRPTRTNFYHGVHEAAVVAITVAIVVVVVVATVVAAVVSSAAAATTASFAS